MKNHRKSVAAAFVSVAVCVLVVLASVGLPLMAQTQAYDLVINNGRVMDPETMYDDIANVGVKDGRIAVITKSAITGTETIRKLPGRLTVEGRLLRVRSGHAEVEIQ